MNPQINLTLPGHAPIPVTAEIAASLDRTLAEFRRTTTAVQRDLEGEIYLFLSTHPGASTIEIARGVRARDAVVRSVLLNGPDFERAHTDRPNARRAKRWTLASPRIEVVPEHGTGSHVGGTRP